MKQSIHTAVHTERRFARTALVTTIANAFMVTTLGTAAMVVTSMEVLAEATTPSVKTSSARNIYNIPAGSLEAALNQLGREAGILLSFSYELTAELKSKDLNGSYSVEEALSLLLQGSGLTSVRQANGSYLLSSNVVHQGGIKALDDVVVTAHARDYNSNSVAKSAVGLELDILKTPAAISVISADLLEDQQVNNVDEALRNVAGVTKYKTGNGGEERFSIRGFDASQSIYKDGARINNSLNVSNIPSTETANIERIEVLKGPSALIYGQGEPGGIINYITKKPELARQTTVELLGGSDSFKKFELDTTGAFSDSETFAYRLVSAYQDSDGFRNEVSRERLLVNPTIAYMPSAATQVVLGFEYIDDKYTQDRGQVLDGNNITGYFYGDRLNESQFFGVPGWNRNTEAESSRIYLTAEHQLTNAWRIEANFSQTKNDKTNFDSSPSYLDENSGVIVGAVGTPVANLVAIGPRKSIGEGETTRYDIKNFIDFYDGFGFEHQMLASISQEEFSTESTGFRADRAVIFDVETGQYFSQNLDPVEPGLEEIHINDDIVFGIRNRGFSKNQAFEESGINVLDYITFNDHWAWLIGGRYSDYKDTLNDYDDNNFSARTGVVYSVDENLSFYASYSEGYSRSGGLLDGDGQVIDPETSTSWELGSKLQLFDDQVLLTATVYRTEKQDLAFVVNPDAPEEEYFFENLGAIRSQGLELEAVGHITYNWRVQAGYTYIDSEIIEGGVGDFGDFPKGNTLGGIAPHNFNLFTFYEFPLAKGYVGVGGGIYYQGEVYTSTENRDKYDAWTQADLAGYYKQDKWKIQLNVNNITDESYRQTQALISSDDFAAIRVGTSTPRNLVASIAYEF